MPISSDEQRKAMFAGMNQVDVGISSTQIGIPNEIPSFGIKDEDEINNFAESNFEKFEDNEIKVVKDKILSNEEKVKAIMEIEKEENAIDELAKTVKTVQSPNSSGDEKFMSLDKFLNDSKHSSTLPKSIRDKLESQRETLEHRGFGNKISTDQQKEDNEVLMSGHEIDVEVKISNG